MRVVGRAQPRMICECITTTVPDSCCVGLFVFFVWLFFQGNRQGMDMGTEYRSIVLCEDKEQLDIALASKEAKQVNDKQAEQHRSEHART